MQERIRTIVAGVAEIQRTDPCLTPAAELAQRVGAVLHVVHAFWVPEVIVAPPDGAMVFAPDGSQPRQDEVLALLDAQVRNISAGGGIVCHAVAASPAEAVVATAERERADLILVGASRSGAVTSMLLGTTAQRVLRAACAPVLVKRRASHDAPRRILLTTDLSSLSCSVHARGLELLETVWGSGAAEVRSLHVAGDDLLLPLPGYQATMRKRAEKELDEFLRRTHVDGLTVAGTVRLGLAAREIVAEAAEWGADLLVLGTHGRTGLSRFLIGSVAESVSRKAQCDVLMIPAAAIRSA